MVSNIIVLIMIFCQFLLAKEIKPKEDLPKAQKSLERCHAGEKKMCHRALAQAGMEDKSGVMFTKTFESICQKKREFFKCQILPIVGDTRKFGNELIKDHPKRGVLYTGEPGMAYVIDEL